MEDSQAVPDAPDAARPAAPPLDFLPLKAFTTTYIAKLTPLHMTHIQLAPLLRPAGHVVLLETNFSHQALPGWEQLVKPPRPPRALAPPGRRQRPVEGDGTCFNSALEPRIMLGGPPGEALGPKLYRLKFFPTTGEAQIVGVRMAEAEDGRWLIQTWAEFLSQQLGQPVRVLEQKVCMSNYKSKLCMPKGGLLDLDLLTQKLLERPQHRVGDTTISVFEVQRPVNEAKASFRFALPGTGQRVLVKLFPSGKVNMLGVPSRETAQAAFVVLQHLARQHPELVCVPPPPDAPRRPRKAPERQENAPKRNALADLPAEIVRQLAELLGL